MVGANAGHLLKRGVHACILPNLGSQGLVMDSLLLTLTLRLHLCNVAQGADEGRKRPIRFRASRNHKEYSDVSPGGDVLYRLWISVSTLLTANLKTDPGVPDNQLYASTSDSNS